MTTAVRGQTARKFSAIEPEGSFFGQKVGKSREFCGSVRRSAADCRRASGLGGDPSGLNRAVNGKTLIAGCGGQGWAALISFVFLSDGQLGRVYDCDH